MAMDNLRLGSAIAATIQSFRQPVGTEISVSLLEEMWQEIAQDIIDEIKDHADIVLQAGDIIVPGGGLADSFGGPISGSASNASVTIEGQIE